MSVDKDPNGTDQAPPAERPPAVSERLWNLIEPGSRRRYVRQAALGLRRGIHPETTITAMLQRENGWDDADIEAALAPSNAHPDEQVLYDDDHYDGSYVDTKPAADTQQPHKSDTYPIRPPVWAFGTEGYRRSATPVGEIGGILHYESGFDGPTAAEIEWLVHRAIARDPSFVLNDPANLQLLGCVLPQDVMASIRSSVVFECNCVIEDIRRRRSAGDLAAMTWIDPDELVL